MVANHAVQHRSTRFPRAGRLDDDPPPIGAAEFTYVPPHIFGGDLKPLCDLCNTRHEMFQAHVFASNAASNNASNTESASNNASNRGSPVLPDVREVASGDGASSGQVDADADGVRAKQRWSREAYNAYQREYMRKRRGK